MEVDVLIVGAGPAGSTTARYCAGKDSRVLLIDRRREIGYPVQCGEFLPAPKEMYSMFPRTMDLEELFRIDSEHVKGVPYAACDVLFPSIPPGTPSALNRLSPHSSSTRVFPQGLARQDIMALLLTGGPWQGEQRADIVERKQLGPGRNPMPAELGCIAEGQPRTMRPCESPRRAVLERKTYLPSDAHHIGVAEAVTQRQV